MSIFERVCRTKPLTILMFHTRTTKTASGATAVQIVRYHNRKTVIVQHVGSTHDAKELTVLKRIATDWIAKTTNQPSLFPSFKSTLHTLVVEQCRYQGFRYGLLYEVFTKLFTIFQFHYFRNPLLTDLVVARIVAPGSKLQALEFLEEFLSIPYARSMLYRQLPEFVHLKEKVEAKVLAIAKKEFRFMFSLVFYDVTTLYFESFEPDNLRKTGFSKDNKSQQPQILIGLLVTAEGFPVAYQMFEGNTFEGHTLLPLISEFQRKYKITSLTVVADAAMISMDNITALRKSNLHYIVGARTANLSPKLIQDISAKLHQQDGATVRIPTEYGDLLCDFSAKRFTKDQREMNKQLSKAEELLRNPSGIKRTKFIKSPTSKTYSLNTEVVEKTKLLLGMKGYYTDLGPEVSDQLIIEQYHNLWHVEHAFRVAKSDLKMRPIYHFKEEMIKAHVVICFMALAVCKYMELKTGLSTKHIVKQLKRVTDARLLNTLTNEELVLRSEINCDTKLLLSKLGVSY